MARRIPPRHQNKPKIRVKVKIKKDDTVKIIAGRDRGKTGRVLQVDAVKGKVLIEGVSASMLASVAPLVKMTFLASAPTKLATFSRASSTNRRAARPSACTDDAFPVSSSAATMTARASSRRGAVAFQSK